MECALQHCDTMVETASSHSSLEANIVKKLGRNLNLGQMTCVILIFTIDCRKPYTNDFIFPWLGDSQRVFVFEIWHEIFPIAVLNKHESVCITFSPVAD